MLDSLHSHLEKASGYLDLNLLADAMEAIEDIDQDDLLRPEVWRLRCQIYRKAENWDAVQDVAKHLVSLEPETAEYWLWTAEATEKVQNRLAAKRILDLALRYHSEHSLLRYQLAVYACGEGDLVAAKEHLRAAFSVNESLKMKMLRDPALAAIC